MNTIAKDNNQPYYYQNNSTNENLRRGSSLVENNTTIFNKKKKFTKKERWTSKDKIALAIVLSISAVTFIWNLSKNGYANSFYSAAAQAGSKSWEAFLWGSLDSSNAITIDKPPLGIWLPALFVRIFGLSSWSILLPQALLGIATTAIIFAMVRRYFNWITASLASLLFISTPVVVLMFRFNNPDALLVFFMTAAIYFTMRAIEDGKSKWLIACGAMIGFGFLTKQFQVLLITPGIALTYLTVGPNSFKKRLLQGLYTIIATIVSAGWWVLLTVIVPAKDRPYIGGSQHNSFIELTFGYNGFGRLTGNETGSVGGGGGKITGAAKTMNGGGPGGGAMGGKGSLGRLFTETYASQWSWYAIPAFVLSVAALILIGKKHRSNKQRSMIMLWGMWYLTTFLVFSFMSGIFHQYYTVALAPATAILTAIGLHILVVNAMKSAWKKIPSVTILIITAVITVLWSFHIASETNYMSWIKWAGLITTIISTSILLGVFIMENNNNNQTINSENNQDITTLNEKDNFFNKLSPAKKGMVSSLSILAIAGAIATPIAWSANTANSSHNGSIVTAGPNGGGMGGGPGGGMGNSAMGGNNNSPMQGNNNGTSTNGNGNSNNSQTQQNNGMMGGAPGGNSMGGGGSAPQNQQGMGQNGSSSSNQQGMGQMGGNTQGNQQGNSLAGVAGGGNSGMGGLLNGTNVSTQTVASLSTNASNYKWVAATIGSQNAASYQLATNEAVMSIGGFNGSDPSPTLKQFQQYVNNKQIHYFIPGGNFGGQNGGSNTGSQITNWVKANYKSVTVGGVTMYDLTQKK